MAQVIQTQVDCSTAQEFLDALSPLGAYFREAKLSEPWLFRGQGQDLPLIPSAFRINGKFASLTRRHVSDYDQWKLAERDILIDFFHIADRRGLLLPDDSQELRSTLETLKSSRGDFLIERSFNRMETINKILSLMALAQHYGVPTRLLDWTRQPLIAAFFAAETALKHVSESELASRLVVWAFYFPILGRHDVLARDNDHIIVVTAPSATNANLRAQQGVFTLLNTLYTREEESAGKYPAFEQYLEEKAFPEVGVVNTLLSECRLRKFTLPATEAKTLLYLLAKLDISPSAVYPGYESIVSDLRIRALWE